MATRAKSICRHPGCGQLLELAGYCTAHIKLVRKQTDDARGTAHQRGYNPRWQKARATFLMLHPLCKHCNEAGRLTPASEVDHIVPHGLKQAIDSGDEVAIARARALFWDSYNWQPLCKSCHSRKTARDDGGFGR